MLCLSIRQPWARMILHCGKDIENRPWSTKGRGWNAAIQLGCIVPRTVHVVCRHCGGNGNEPECG